MLFNSFEFLLFFPVVTLLYYLLPHRWRWLLLLLASCGFYMAFIPAYILILVFTILVDYAAGLLIENAQGGRRKLYLALSVAANVGVLGVFKYYNFFIDNTNALLHTSWPLLHLVLPIGLSFHTFQAMSYTIEVYRGRYPAERHLGLYALYVLFYPQLVAGPIERPQQMLPQLHERKRFDYQGITSGLRLMAWGLFKKVVVADRLAFLVNHVFDAPQHFRGLPLLVASVGFSIQIYCDFSGYSDIALGAAQVMGFRLMQNFERPYFSRSVGEFWRRWHISLSNWFRDYLYLPLGGSRAGRVRSYCNLLLVFVVSGLWHGASWTFVAWGALHGFYLVFGRLTRPLRARLPLRPPPWLQALATYALVTLAWIFFRAATIADGFYVVRHLLDGAESRWPSAPVYGLHSVAIFYDRDEKLALLGGLLVLALVETLQGRLSLTGWLTRQAAPVRWALYYGLVLSIVLLGAFEHRQFIYFQF
ncbi:MAG: MBOAT family O-acyltransferase [Janthinobacterium lividum]